MRIEIAACGAPEGHVCCSACHEKAKLSQWFTELFASERVRRYPFDMTACHGPTISASPAMPRQRIDISHVELSLGAIELIRGRNVRLPGVPHFHDFFAVGLVDEGTAQLRYRGARSLGSAGALMTITAGEVHSSGPPGDGNWSYRVMYMQRGLLRRVLGDEVDDERILFAGAFAADRQSAMMFETAYRALKAADCQLAGEEQLFGFLRVVSERHASQPPHPPRHRTGSFVRVARDYMEARYADRVDLATLAGVCGVSPFHLIRAFRREYGIPPHGYLKQVRIGRALALLRQGLSATQVAYSCGFCDQSHLTRNFRSVFGLPPGMYQRAIGAVSSKLQT